MKRAPNACRNYGETAGCGVSVTFCPRCRRTTVDPVPPKPTPAPVSSAPPGQPPEAALGGGLVVRGRRPWAISWRVAWLILVGGSVLAVVVSQTTRLPRTPGAVLVIGI